MAKLLQEIVFCRPASENPPVTDEETRAERLSDSHKLQAQSVAVPEVLMAKASTLPLGNTPSRTVSARAEL